MGTPTGEMFLFRKYGKQQAPDLTMFLQRQQQQQ